ncbi:MAG TPA: hypothetical protein VKX16_15430 [Chloroflexota bacterium]|nr:hypothetical protein [Chloroflexota bacterium]
MQAAEPLSADDLADLMRRMSTLGAAPGPAVTIPAKPPTVPPIRLPKAHPPAAAVPEIDEKRLRKIEARAARLIARHAASSPAARQSPPARKPTPTPSVPAHDAPAWPSLSDRLSTEPASLTERLLAGAYGRR